MGQLDHEWILFDCQTGEHRPSSTASPYLIGRGDRCDWKIESPGGAAVECVIDLEGDTCRVSPAPGATDILLDGMVSAGGELTLEDDHTLVLDGHLLAIRGGANLGPWLTALNPQEWFIFDRTTTTKFGPCTFAELGAQLPRVTPDTSEAVIFCRGLTTMGFYADHVLPYLAPPSPANGTVAATAPEGIDVEYGEFTCPVCWLKFDRGDAMNVAVHAALRGDPILGETHMQRFQATRFNDRGQAIDAMGIPAPDQACPHCRRRLPQGFLDEPHHIFSIVGAPSSGKSYYLSVLVKTLQTTLFQRFGVTFRDAVPSENVLLNQMKTQLFSASTPEEAVLAKTELEGAMYETLPRLGRKVRLPKPFIFNLSNPRDPAQDFAIVFYDNAGEHFEPTRNSADSPGAQHIAAASGIFFLFDPLHHPEFRRRLKDVKDPQLELRRMDQQDVILAETEVRIKNLLGLDSRQRMSTPFAVVVGKSDTWRQLLAEKEIGSPVRDGYLDLDALTANSTRIRDLLLELSPEIVSNAEAISSEVRYFAASPLGSSPVAFEDARGVTMIGPDPSKLDPQQAEIPTLWVLSRIAPGMVPTRSKNA